VLAKRNAVSGKGKRNNYAMWLRWRLAVFVVRKRVRFSLGTYLLRRRKKHEKQVIRNPVYPFILASNLSIFGKD